MKRRVLSGETVEAAEPATVVVELQPGKPNNHLLALAAALARRHESPVDALVITEVPYQSPLEGSAPGASDEWLAKIRARTEAYGVGLRLHPVLARDRAQAILTFTHSGTRALLLDWHDAFHPVRIRGSYVDTVLRKSPVRVGVLKYRGHRRYDRILVATAGGPYDVAEMEMADALAQLTQARLTLLMVLPQDASTGREEQARDYLDHLHGLTRAKTDDLLVRGEDVLEEILSAGEDHDLVVLGATREPRIRHLFAGHLVGPIADEIAERAEGSVLVTRDPTPSQRMSTAMVRWLRRTRAGLTGRERRPAGEPPWRAR